MHATVHTSSTFSHDNSILHYATIFCSLTQHSLSVITDVCLRTCCSFSPSSNVIQFTTKRESFQSEKFYAENQGAM